MKKLILLLFLTFCSCNQNKANQYFDDIADNDVKLSKPVEGEWLYTHKEKGQSFEQFINSRHVVPTNNSNIIYMKKKIVIIGAGPAGELLVVPNDNAYWRVGVVRGP